MYRSLGDLVRGWMKTVYAGGIETLPPGRAWRALYPLILLAPIVVWLAPPIALALWWIGLASDSVGSWAIATCAVLVVCWTIIYAAMTRRPWYALAAPLGNVVLAYIFLRAIARGRQVEWKGRAYEVG